MMSACARLRDSASPRSTRAWSTRCLAAMREPLQAVFLALGRDLGAAAFDVRAKLAQARSLGRLRLQASAHRAMMTIPWLLHAATLLVGFGGQPPQFGFAPALSVTAWLVLTVYLVESRLYPQFRARWTLAALGTVTVLLALLFPGSPYPALRSSWLPLHWALGISSYGLIGAAVVHAWLMQRAEKAMRQGTTTDSAMPLLMLERLTFRFLAAGFALLSATLLAGWWGLRSVLRTPVVETLRRAAV